MHPLAKQRVRTNRKRNKWEGWKREKDVEDETRRRRWMTSNSRRGVGSWQGNRLKLQGSWLPSPSLWTLVDSRWSCTGWRKMNVNMAGSGLADDEWSSPRQSYMFQVDRGERRCLSHTSRTLLPRESRSVCHLQSRVCTLSGGEAKWEIASTATQNH